MRRRATLLVAAAIGLVLTATAAVQPATAEPGADTSAPYEVYDATSLAQRNRIARTGAAIDDVGDGVVAVTATKSELKALRALGFTVLPVAAEVPQSGVSALDFPTRDALYHNYSEMTAEVNQIVAQYPAIASKKVLGTTYEGRQIVAVKISDNVGTDENEPEILYDATTTRGST